MLKNQWKTFALFLAIYIVQSIWISGMLEKPFLLFGPNLPNNFTPKNIDSISTDYQYLLYLAFTPIILSTAKPSLFFLSIFSLLPTEEHCLTIVPFLFYIIDFPHLIISLLVCAEFLSHVWLFVVPWTKACQALLAMEFSRQE